MSAEKETLARVNDALFHLRKGLASFVARHMEAVHGADWIRHASRAGGTRPDDPLDVYGLLKTMLDSWPGVFRDSFGPHDRGRARTFMASALDGRNMAAHAGQALEDEAALRTLDACHQLLKLAKAPDSEIAEVKLLYDAQRYAGLPVAPPAAPAPAIKAGTIEDRLLAFIRKNPDLDDDQLAKLLDIQPRQSINMTARRLEKRGLLRRFKGPMGKLVNRAEKERP